MFESDSAPGGQLWDNTIRNKPLFAALGLVCHGLLNGFEADYKFHAIIPLAAQLFFLSVLIEYLIGSSQSLLQSWLTVATSATVFLGTFILSVLVYRAFFHRLRKFPGPFLARLTKLYAVKIVSDGPYYEEIERLHRQHGAFVRTGPRELSIADANAIPLLYGANAVATKGPWYSHAIHVEGEALHTTRNKEAHRQARKDWDRALGASSLREYSPRINRHTKQLIDELAKRAKAGDIVNITDWMGFYSGDVIGDIGFSYDFGMVKAGKRTGIIAKSHEANPMLSFAVHLPAIGALITRTGKGAGAKPLFEHIDWAWGVLRHRAKNPPREKDIMSFLLDPNDEDIPFGRNADARITILAGLETTASTLAWLCYELCKDPSVQAKLRDAVREVAGDRTLLEAEDVNHISYLDDVINEALRLHSAVASGVQRETPPEGITVSGTYIPGNVLTWMPLYTLQRSATYFAEPLRFEPERWRSKPEMVINKSAFIPFQTGPYKCVGWQLAMREMRSVVANLVLNFEIAFVEGDDGESVNKEALDCFATVAGPLNINLTPISPSAT